MSSVDHEKVIQRLVAGMPFDETALAEAIAASAIDRTAVVEALVNALSSPEATARLRAAERVIRMDDVAEEVAEALLRMTSADIDPHVRAAAARALQTHGRAIQDEQPPEPHRAPLLVLRRLALRSGASVPLLFLPADRSNAHSRGLASPAEDGGWRLALTGLPAAFVGTLPVLRVGGDDGPIVLGIAAEPVTPEGAVTIVIAPEAGTVDEIERRLSGSVDVTVEEDGWPLCVRAPDASPSLT